MLERVAPRATVSPWIRNPMPQSLKRTHCCAAAAGGARRAPGGAPATTGNFAVLVPRSVIGRTGSGRSGKSVFQVNSV